MNSNCIHQLCIFSRFIRYIVQRVLKRKVVLIMKLACFFFVALSLQLHAESHGQTVSISVTNAPLKTALKQVKAQSGYAYFLSDELLKKANPVSLHITGVSVKQALDRLFADQPVDYHLTDKIISLR